VGVAAAALTFAVLAVPLRLFTSDEIGLIKDGLGRIRRKIPGLRRPVPTAALEAPPSA
jgi:hypothetical protein